MIPKKKLTHKENEWVNFYCSNGGNQTKASISAGYSEKSARNNGMRMMTKAHILEAIKERQKPIAEKHKITRESLIADLENIKEKCLDIDVDKGIFPQYNNALKAIEQTAKMLGLNEPEKVEISGQVDMRLQKLKRMNENDLKKEMIEL